MGPPGPPRPRKSAISARPKTHVLKTQAYSKSRSNYELRASKQQNEDGKQQRTSGRFIIHGIFVRGSPRIKPRRETLQGGFCQQKHRHRNTDPKIGPGGNTARKPKENRPQSPKTVRKSGTPPEAKGCIHALTVSRQERERTMPDRRGPETEASGLLRAEESWGGLSFLVAVKPRNKIYNLSFAVFLSIPDKTWPRYPFQQVRFCKWFIMHSTLSPETNCKANSSQFPRLGPKNLNLK